MSRAQIPGQTALFDDDYGRPIYHQTSADGYQDVKTYRAGTQKHKMLVAFSQAPLWAHGLTAEEAATACDLLHTMYWCRITELRADGLIQIETIMDGQLQLTRPGASGNERLVYSITDAGRAMLVASKKK